MEMSQNWSRGKPIFFIEGIRVTLERGYNAFKAKGIKLNDKTERAIHKKNIRFAPFDFLILDEFDAPSEKNICQATRKGKAEYIHPHKVRARKPIRTYKPISVTEFGMVFIIDGKNLVHFEKQNRSIATYSDGEHRRWQGKNEFSLPLWMLIN